MVVEYQEIASKLRELGKVIKAPNYLCVLPSMPQSSGEPHLEIRDGEYHLIYSERGQEVKHLITSDTDELLYWVCKDMVSMMASYSAVEDKLPGQDFRKLWFEYQLELMGQLSNRWQLRLKQEL